MDAYGNLNMILQFVISLKPEVVGGINDSDCHVLKWVNTDMLIIVLPNKVIAYHPIPCLT